VQIYDYVDVHVKMLERMYGKRLKGYASIGYKVKGGNIADAPADIIFDKDSFLPVYVRDIENASNQLLIVSPFVTNKRVNHIIRYFEKPLEKKVGITIITRPTKDFGGRNAASLERSFDTLSGMGVCVKFKSKIHQKFAIIDQKIVWYGSINLLSFGAAQESMMRLVSGNIAHELTASVWI